MVSRNIKAFSCAIILEIITAAVLETSKIVGEKNQK
jgi:hypothetical protein